ncbi:hypothetical protein LSH36_662g02056 [Paralvinella palmiformis]|uniref:Uncharacterized protein n=1 Tax=Paralvinella palmiformis TaxID=53620 RepID=A0AAD9J3J5_9ANNE|nr:hypothetical protein LSH36_662g02056 [Paralvinella palmiformis]
MLPVIVPDPKADGEDSASEKQDTVVDMAVIQRSNTKKLIVCFLGIFVSYFVYGLLQEKMCLCMDPHGLL